MPDHDIISLLPDDAARALWRRVPATATFGRSGLELLSGVAAVLLVRHALLSRDGAVQGDLELDPARNCSDAVAEWERLIQEASASDEGFEKLAWRVAARSRWEQFSLASEILVREFKRLPSAARLELLHWAAELDLASSQGRHFAGEVLSSLLSLSIDNFGSAGGFVTAAAVAQLMAEVAAPQPGESIYDPCFGAANVLVACASRAQALAAQEGAPAGSQAQAYGSELHDVPFAVGFTRLLLAGASVHLHRGDTLRHSDARGLFQRQFDVVVANPPWGARRDGAPRDGQGAEHLFAVPSRSSELLFMQHIMGSLRIGGRAVVCLPEGPLFQEGAARRVREALLHDFAVEGVISLAVGALAPFSSSKSNQLVFRRAQSSGPVRFFTAPTLAGGSMRARLGGSAVPASTPAEVAERFLVGEEGADLWTVPVAELDKRKAELVAKRPPEEMFAALGRLAPESQLQVVALEQVASIRRGVSYRKDGTEPHRTASGDAVGLIRIAEMQEGRSHGVHTPSLALKPEVARKYLPERLLQAGDILVAAVGTSGKVCLVPREAVGTIASSNIFVVRPREGVAPRYLLALLRSQSFADWFASRALGSTVRSLAISDLSRFPVPLPPPDLQEEVAREWAVRGHDAAEVLAQRISRAGSDPLALWLRETPEVRQLLKEPLSESEAVLPALERIARPLQVLRNRVVHPGQLHLEDTRLQGWAMSLGDAARLWSDLSSIPTGSVRMLLLEQARATLAQAEARLQSRPQSTYGSATQALRFTRELSRLNARLSESIAQAVEVVARLVPDAIEASFLETPQSLPIQVELRLRNGSALPLRALSLQISEADWQHSIPFLAESSEIALALPVPLGSLAATSPTPGTSPTQQVGLTLQWRALRLDGQPVEGSIGLALLVSPSNPPTEPSPDSGVRPSRSTEPTPQADGEASVRASVLVDDLDSNPYITGLPVPGDRKEMLVGRDGILASIGRQLRAQHHANVLVLQGNRRTGKSSILERLKSDPQPGWVVALCSMNEGQSEETEPVLSTTEVCRLWARSLVEALLDEEVCLWPPLPSFVVPELVPKAHMARRKKLKNALDAAFDATTRPFDLFEDYLQDALEAASPRRVLLMIDEVDKLAHSVERGTASPMLLENLRSLLQKHRGFTAIFTGSQRLKQLTESYWSALFGLGERIAIGRLSLEASRDLVSRPVQGQMAFTEEARDEIVRLCARQPYLIQGFCSHLFEHAVETGQRTVTLPTVSEAARQVRAGHGLLSSLWQDAQTERRRFILALCANLSRDSQSSEPLTLDLIQAQVEANGIAVQGIATARSKEIRKDLGFLCDLDALEHRDSIYSLAIPLLARWIEVNCDFSHQRLLAQEEAQAL